MFEAARRFILNQRITELENAIRHFPLSKFLEKRQKELEELKEELARISPKA